VTALLLIAAVVLLAGNAVFVAAEFAVVSVRRTQLEALAVTSRRARRVLEGQDRLPLLLAAAQLGITVCSLGLGAVAEPAVAAVLEGGLDVVRVPAGVLHPLAFAVALTLVVLAHMVLGEMVPKNLALAGPERAAVLLGPLLLGTVRLTGPVIRGLNALADGVLRLLRVEPVAEGETAYTPEQLVDIVDESRAEGLLDDDDSERLRTALALRDRRAHDVMIPLGRLATVAEGVTAEQLEEAVARTGWSRFPVRRAGDGALLGFVHAKDVLGVPSSALRRPLPATVVRALPAVPADLPLPEVLTLLQRSGSHLGQVSRGGNPIGVIALEDVVEEFVGEVADAASVLEVTPAPPGQEMLPLDTSARTATPSTTR